VRSCFEEEEGGEGGGGEEEKGLGRNYRIHKAPLVFSFNVYNGGDY
jgi:hypothetical protein